MSRRSRSTPPATRRAPGPVLVALLVLASCASQDVASPRETVSGAVARAVDDAWAAHVEAGRRKDLDGVLAIYHPDVVYEPAAGTLFEGVAAVADSERAALRRNDVLEARHRTLFLRVVGERAWETGTIEGPVRTDGGATRIMTWHFMALWVHAPGAGWRIRHLVGRVSG